METPTRLIFTWELCVYDNHSHDKEFLQLFCENSFFRFWRDKSYDKIKKVCFPFYYGGWKMGIPITAMDIETVHRPAIWETGFHLKSKIENWKIRISLPCKLNANTVIDWIRVGCIFSAVIVLAINLNRWANPSIKQNNTFELIEWRVIWQSWLPKEQITNQLYHK